MYLIYLDDYHLDDLLFVPGLAQRMGRMRRERPGYLFVHGSGGEAERLLEAEGLFPERKDGLVQVRMAREAALVERALRQVNRRIVGALTEEGVHAVGFQGSDRGLLRQGEDGAVTAGRVAWLAALVEKGAVPVVSASVQDAGATRAVSLPAATAALARASDFDEVVVVFFTQNNQPGVVEGEHLVPHLSLDALPPGLVPDPAAARPIVRAGIPVLLTSANGLFGGDEPTGTRIFHVKTAKKD